MKVKNVTGFMKGMVVIMLTIALIAFAEGNVFAAEEAAGAAGASSAGTAAGAATSAGITTGTIVAGAVVAAAAVAIVASSGGGTTAAAVTPTPTPTPIPDLSAFNADQMAALNNVMQNMSAADLENFQAALATMNFGDIAAALTAAPSAADATDMQNFLTNLKNGTAAQQALYAQIKALLQQMTADTFAALKTYIAALDPAKLDEIKAALAAAVQDALAIWVATHHPGYGFTLVTTHHGNGVYTTTVHLTPSHH